MLYIYASVSGIFIHMLQVFHLDFCIFLQWLHTCFQAFPGDILLNSIFYTQNLHIIIGLSKIFKFD
jgi:hypothetical protein